jgi:hypothetical protein
MDTKALSVLATPGRTRYRPPHFAPVLVARLIVVVLALIGVIAIALLVLGLLNRTRATPTSASTSTRRPLA